MTYRAYSRRRRVSVPFVLVILGVVIVLLGLGLLSLVFYLSASVEPAARSNEAFAVNEVFYEFLVVLFDGGVLTLGGGSILMFVGGLFVVRPSRR